jgi:predicted NAD/FAD-binding protein
VKIAIIGSGVSGLVAAHLLHPRHDVTVFEAEPRIGGHTHTCDVELDGERHAIDTGFIVYNETTYPLFTRLLERLRVATRPTDMSFSVRCERSGLEWGSRGLRGVFAQPSNLLRSPFRRMLADVFRFGSEAAALLEQGEEKVELGDYLNGAAYSEAFVRHYVVPMGAAIWSADPSALLRMPAVTFVRFLSNHGLLDPKGGGIRWRVVRGGSARYVERLVAPFRGRIQLDCPVLAVRRSPSHVEVVSARGTRAFDRAVLAVHSDQALRMLADASELERRVLGAISYQRNAAVLHTDASLLPRRRAARASWNYRISAGDRNAAFVTYDMNRLQGIRSRHRFLVTLNGCDAISPDRVLRRLDYAHPVLDRAAVAAQKLHGAIDGVRRTHFCGAYWGYGFHEDGVRSASAVCERIEAGA